MALRWLGRDTMTVRRWMERCAVIRRFSVKSALQTCPSSIGGRKWWTTPLDGGGIDIKCAGQQHKNNALSVHNSLQCRGGSGQKHRNDVRVFSLQNALQCRGFAWSAQQPTSRGDPHMKNCRSIEELCQTAYEHVDMSPRGMSAFWSLVPKFLSKEERRARKQHFRTFSEQMLDQIDAILTRTLDGIDSYSPRDLSATTLGIAKVMKIICNAEKRLPEVQMKRFPEGSLYHFLHNLLIGDNSATKQLILLSIAESSLPSLSEWDSQDLSNFIYAFAIADYVPENERGDNFLELISEKVMCAIDKSSGGGRQFIGQAFSNIVWSYATLGQSHPELFTKIANHIVALDTLDRFWPQALSNVCWAYATAKESHPKLFKKIADHILELDSFEAFNRQHHSNIPWAYATNGHIDQRLFKSLAPMAAAFIGRYNRQNLANIAWAFAVANVAAPSLFNDEFINACIERENEFTAKELRQLHQFNLWHEELQSDIILPLSFQEKCYNAFVSAVTAPSALQDDVVSNLCSLGLQLEKEALTKSGYRLDALVEVNGEKIAIEVNGPSHFLGREPAGKTILKYRQVTNLDGIRVVSVPYWDWNDIGKSRWKKDVWNRLGEDGDKKQQYLRSLLDKVGCNEGFQQQMRE